jgi:beta-lactam-binding protein with PASTA domain
MLGDSMRRRSRSRRTSDPATRGRWRPLLIAAPIALIVFFALGYLMAVYVLFPPLPEAAATANVVPQLVGRSGAEAQRELVTAGLGALEATELPHPSAPAGRVIAQSPLAGQQLRPGASVSVALSAGRPQVLVPDVHGYGVERAAGMLQRAGFEVLQAGEQSPLPAGRVLGSDPGPGQVLTLPASVTLRVSSGPPPADTIPPDTVPGGG